MRKTMVGKKKRAVKAVLSALPSKLRWARVDAKAKQTARRRITIETERTLIFRNRNDLRAAWCAECGAEVHLATVEAAAHAAGKSELFVYQFIESGKLHFIEMNDRRIWVCLNSLRQQFGITEGERSCAKY
jgi:hypothetical protein